jgi:hypothetical protein
MQSKTTDQLLAIWNNRETGEYTSEALEIVRLALLERGVQPPEADIHSLGSALETADLSTSGLETTRLLCAAAHLRHSSIYGPLRARSGDADNLKADTPEYFVDVKSLRKEAAIAHDREIFRRWIVAVTAAVGMVMISGGNEGAPLLVDTSSGGLS